MAETVISSKYTFLHCASVVFSVWFIVYPKVFAACVCVCVCVGQVHISIYKVCKCLADLFKQTSTECAGVYVCIPCPYSCQLQSCALVCALKPNPERPHFLLVFAPVLLHSGLCLCPCDVCMSSTCHVTQRHCHADNAKQSRSSMLLPTAN